jgi:glycosyltransferase involved in cell wall biosynthesis
MSTADLVSVVLAVHDVRPWIEACLDSLLAQTHTRLEVIVVDDGSSDGSGDVCDRYAAVDARVRALHKTNGGLSDARNAGLDQATGEWVMFLDGDDWIDHGAVDRLLRGVYATQVDVVVAGFHVDVHDVEGNLVSTERRTPRPCVVESGATPSPLVTPELLNFVGYAWNKLYRRSLLDELGTRFPVGVSLVEDVLFNAPVLSHARVNFVDEAFVHYIQRPRPTLGTRPHTEFAVLMARASEAASGLLAAWGVTPQRSAELVHHVEVHRVLWALRSALVARGSVRMRLAQGRTLLEDSRVRSVLKYEAERGVHRGPRAWLLATQARGHVLPTWVALCARSIL